MSLPGVSIGGYHCYSNWGCYLAEKEIEYPEIRTHLVEVPSRDGYIDMTKYLRGTAVYGNRTITIKLLYKAPYTKWVDKLNTISNAVHGKKLSIIFDDDSSYKYIGWCSVSTEAINKWETYIVIEADCEPFKYAVEPIVTQYKEFTCNVGEYTTSKFLLSALTTSSRYYPVFEMVDGRGKAKVTAVGKETVSGTGTYDYSEDAEKTIDFGGGAIFPTSGGQIQITVKSVGLSYVSSATTLVANVGLLEAKL